METVANRRKPLEIVSKRQESAKILKITKRRQKLEEIVFPQALLAGFSFRTGEYKAFAVRKIAAKPENVPILHKIVPGNLLGNLLGNVPGPFFVKKM